MGTNVRILIDNFKESEFSLNIYGIEIKEGEKSIILSNYFRFDINNMSLLQLLWNKNYIITLKDVVIEDSYYLENLFKFDFFHRDRIIFKNCHIPFLNTNSFHHLKGITKNKFNINLDDVIIIIEKINLFNEFMEELYSLNFKKIKFRLNSIREFNLTKKDLTNLSKDINYRKIRIGCKAMTLPNWYKFFNFETYHFETHRDSDNFANMKIQFNKFYASITSYSFIKN